LLLRGEGQEIGDGVELVDLGLQLRVRGEIALELPALALVEGAEGVGALEVVEALAPVLLQWFAPGALSHLYLFWRQDPQSFPDLLTLVVAPDLAEGLARMRVEAVASSLS
jgi:hypothetical protein